MQVNVVPYLIDNPSIGFVQARWTFTNPEESYLTKAGLPLFRTNSAAVLSYVAQSANVLKQVSDSAYQQLSATSCPECGYASTDVGFLPSRSAGRLLKTTHSHAGAADLPELPLQVRAVGALRLWRLFQLQRHCW